MTWWKIAAAGIAGGLAATLATTLFQAAAAPALGQDGDDHDPSNVKAAQSASKATTGQPLPEPAKQPAGSLVHYATGAALGLGYAALVAGWRPASTGFGTAYGTAVALVLDDALVPAFGWGPWPWQTAPATHAYGLSTHLVFGAVLEGGRRLALSALGEAA